MMEEREVQEKSTKWERDCCLCCCWCLCSIGDVVELKDRDPHLLTGTLKLYLRELSDPLIPIAFYDRFVQISQNSGLCFHSFIHSLYLFDFIFHFSVSKSSKWILKLDISCSLSNLGSVTFLLSNKMERLWANFVTFRGKHFQKTKMSSLFCWCNWKWLHSKNNFEKRDILKVCMMEFVFCAFHFCLFSYMQNFVWDAVI
jgi:hypothetical protein